MSVDGDLGYGVGIAPNFSNDPVKLLFIHPATALDPVSFIDHNAAIVGLAGGAIGASEVAALGHINPDHLNPFGRRERVGKLGVGGFQPFPKGIHGHHLPV